MQNSSLIPTQALRLSFITALVAAILLPIADLSAAQQAPAQGTQVPVIVNVYSNANVSNDFIAGAIAAANKILGQANIQLVPVKINNPVTNSNNGDNGDGVFTYDERQAARRFGGKEVAGLAGGPGDEALLREPGQRDQCEHNWGRGASESDDHRAGVRQHQ